MVAAIIALSLCGVLVAAIAVRYRQRAGTLALRLRQSSGDLEDLQTAFERFAPATVVDEIAATGSSTAAQKREVTVMFADLQGFTALTDKLDPAQVVDILNGYFRAMSAVITAHRGHVSKFMGDGLMALFGTLDYNPWQTRDAALAALGMRDALARYNETLTNRGLPTLGFGVGIHRGVGVVGVLGCNTLMEFTVIGDVVNVASRVEALTRTHGVDILVTDVVHDALGDGFCLRELPATPVKGKPEPLVTFALTGVDGDAP